MPTAGNRGGRAAPSSGCATERLTLGRGHPRNPHLAYHFSSPALPCPREDNKPGRDVLMRRLLGPSPGAALAGHWITPEQQPPYGKRRIFTLVRKESWEGNFHTAEAPGRLGFDQRLSLLPCVASKSRPSGLPNQEPDRVISKGLSCPWFYHRMGCSYPLAEACLEGDRRFTWTQPCSP